VAALVEVPGLAAAVVLVVA
jgi:hypothetical protein